MRGTKLKLISEKDAEKLLKYTVSIFKLEDDFKGAGHIHAKKANLLEKYEKNGDIRHKIGLVFSHAAFSSVIPMQYLICVLPKFGYCIEGWEKYKKEHKEKIEDLEKSIDWKAYF